MNNLRKANSCQGILLVILLLTAAVSNSAPVISLPGALSLTVNTSAPEGTEAWDYTYTEAGWSTVLTGLIMKPVGGSNYPAVQLNHGKGGNAVDFAFDKGPSWFTPAGYMVISVELTHAGGVFCIDATNECGGSQENVRRGRRAVEILSSQKLIDWLGEVVDRDRIYAYGNSLGALTTLELAQDLGSRLRAVAITAGGIVLSRNLSYMSPGGEAGVIDVLAPLLQLHGRRDNVIKTWEAEELNDALNLYDKEHQMVWFPNAGHNIAKQDLTAGLVSEFIMEWFDVHGNNEGPSISEVSPGQGGVGTEVTISGGAFGDYTSNSKVSFEDTPAEVISWSDVTIDTIVPETAVSGALQVIAPVGPVADPEVEQPVDGGVRSNRVYFDITF